MGRQQHCAHMHNSGKAGIRNVHHRLSRRRSAALLVPCSYGSNDPQGALSSVTAEATGSKLIRKELVLFLIQQDYDRQLQRALNYENFDVASELRKRREQLTEAVSDFQASKGPGDGARNARQAEVADFASEGLRLRSEMQRAVEDERYSDASALRDRINELQQQADAAATAVEEQRGSGELQFQLGQRVLHAQHGYRGIICGWDVRCCEDEEWRSNNGVDSLSAGTAQPFYHVLVDLRDWEDGNPQSAITYVPEELLQAPESSETWSEEHDDDVAFMHPFANMLFLGNDHAGDYLPSKPLREKYSAQRRDVGPPDEDGEQGDADDAPDGSGGPFSGPGSSGSDGPSGIDIGGPGGGMTIM